MPENANHGLGKLAIPHGLFVCPSPLNSHVEILIPNVVVVLRGGAFGR
jgi:hypothetical protein